MGELLVSYFVCVLMHMTEPLVPEPSSFEVDVTSEKMEIYI
jgi:hypothetical protein